MIIMMQGYKSLIVVMLASTFELMLLHGNTKTFINAGNHQCASLHGINSPSYVGDSYTVLL